MPPVTVSFRTKQALDEISRNMMRMGINTTAHYDGGTAIIDELQRRAYLDGYNKAWERRFGPGLSIKERLDQAMANQATTEDLAKTQRSVFEKPSNGDGK